MALEVTSIPPLVELRGLKYPFAGILISGGYILLSSVNIGEAQGTQASFCGLVFTDDDVGKPTKAATHISPKNYIIKCREKIKLEMHTHIFVRLLII